MEKKYLLGLTFFEKSIQSKKVSNFRNRYDFKFENLKETIIPLLPPIHLRQGKMFSLIEDLADICESHFFGDDLNSLKFSGMDLYMSKDNVLLYMKPELGSDLEHAQDHMYHEILKYIPRGVSFKKPNSFLTIGRFADHTTLNNALERAKVEFTLPFSLPIRGITVYEKNSKGWHQVTELITLTDNSDIFLQSDFCSV